MKAGSLVKGSLRQVKYLFDIKSYDAVLVYREVMLWGRPWIENHIVKRGVPLIFDFDDAIWLTVKSQTGISPSIKNILKPKNKFDDIIKLSSHVIAGNEYLARHARLLNKNVSVLPTVVDIDHYRPFSLSREHHGNFIVGWIGSGSTSEYLRLLNNVWHEFKFSSMRMIKDPNKIIPNNIELHVIGAVYDSQDIKVRNIKWSLNTELEEMSRFDIGIMPLPDDEWTRGKCGLKALEYMAMGIPCIVSPVGVNAEIIQDGINGFIAIDEKEWIAKMNLLIEDPELREKLGNAGRKTVETRYSVKLWASKYLNIINKYATC